MTLVQALLSPEATALYALVIAGLEKKFQFIKPLVKWGEDHKSVVSVAVKEGEKVLNDVIHSPELAGLKAEAENLKNQLEDTRIVQIAGTVIHAFSKSLDSLTEDELSTASLIIKTEAQRLGITVNTNQVLDALKKVQHVADLVASSSLFKATQNVVAEKQAVKATVSAVGPAPSVPEAPASAPVAPPSDVGADPAQTTK